MRPALFPNLFPIPQPRRDRGCQPESELMREHAHLPAMVSFVRDHVTKHFYANRPGLTPAVATKFLDATAVPAERFGEHLCAARCACGESRTGLFWRAVRAAELGRNLQVRSGQPDPLGADVVHCLLYTSDAADE